MQSTREVEPETTEDAEHPDYLVCPVSLQIFYHPVTITGGVTLEQKEADKIIDEGNGLCPLTGMKIVRYDTARAIVQAVDAYLTAKPDAKEDQYEPYTKRSVREVDQTIKPITTPPVASCSAAPVPETALPDAAPASSVSKEEEAATKRVQILADERIARELQEREPDVTAIQEMDPTWRSVLKKEVARFSPTQFQRHHTCSMTGALMLHPVFLLSELSDKKKHFIEQDYADKIMDVGGLCPFTKKPLLGYYTNNVTREVVDLITVFLDLHPDHKCMQYKPYVARDRRDVILPAPAPAPKPQPLFPTHAIEVLKWVPSVPQTVTAGKFATTPDKKSSPASPPSSATPKKKPVSHPEQALRAVSPVSHASREEPAVITEKAVLFGENEKLRSALVSDLRNLIFAFGYEQGPVESVMPQPCPGTLFTPAVTQPWQHIQINKNAPKNEAMYAVLKAAILALNQLNPDILDVAKRKHADEYDLIHDQEQRSISAAGYIQFAEFLGPVACDQPGLYVYHLLERAEAALKTFCPKHHFSLSK